MSSRGESPRSGTRAARNEKEPEPLLCRAVRLAHKEYGEGHPAHGTLLNDLGGPYRTMGRYAESEACFREARQSLAATAGKDDAGYATCLNNLAGLYRLTGWHARNQDLFLDADALHARAPGERHFIYASNPNNLALLYQDTGACSDPIARPRASRSQPTPRCDIE